MFVRRTYGRTYIVESYRRAEDGAPRQRVVASLGVLTDREHGNLLAALQANSGGKHVAVVGSRAPRPVRESETPAPNANLRYLDVAVGLEVWRELGLHQLLGEVLPRVQAEVSDADVICALSLQRLVDPGSKLLGVRWFPRTALPELLKVSSAQFNNTRLHRALEALEDARPRLMSRLSALYRDRGAVFSALFLDVTDTWFVGEGPELAARGKTKEGRLERKIGIVLLCNEDGFPIHWDVVRGTQPDAKTMLDVLSVLSSTNWLSKSPVVVDRAMGCSAHVRSLLDLGVRFVTAIRNPELPTYGGEFPHARFADLRPGKERDEAVVAEAARRAAEVGLERVADNLFVKDLGVVTTSLDEADPADPIGIEREDDHAGDRAVAVEPAAGEAPVQSALLRAKMIRAGIESGKYGSHAAAAKDLGLTRHQVKKIASLANLLPDLQERVSADPERYSVEALYRLARRRDPEEQRKAFEALPRALPRRVRPERRASPTPIRVRAVLTFNPELLVQKRHLAQKRLDAIQRFAVELNQRLSDSRRTRQRSHVLAEVDRRLRRENLIDAFTVTVEAREAGDPLQVEITLKEAEWTRRRRLDGFMLLVAHPEVAIPAAEVARLYRAKDMVEKSFETIKSVVQLRPVRHRDPDKIQAHVTLCMLALLLERTLRKKLDGLGASAPRALEELASCHLNLYSRKDAAAPAYVLTTPTDEQWRLLRLLDLEALGDTTLVADRISPRDL